MTVTEAAAFLREHDNYLILTHKRPDGDTIGSAAGLCLLLRALGKRAFLRCGDPIPQKYAYIYKGLTQPDCTPKTVVASDVADPKLLGSLREAYPDIDLCIDHHKSNTRYAHRGRAAEITSRAHCSTSARRSAPAWSGGVPM